MAGGSTTTALATASLMATAGAASRDARGLVAHAFRPNAWSPLSQPRSGAPQPHAPQRPQGLDALLLRSRGIKLAQSRRTTPMEMYLRALASHHTLFAILCQPHATPGSFHRIDIEQLVQCFWSALMTELAIAAALASSQGGYDYELTPGNVATDATVGAIVSACVALVGCRAVFIWSGPAGRSKLLWQRAAGKKGHEEKEKNQTLEIVQPAAHCCFKLCDCRCDPFSRSLRRRAQRSCVGWSFAIGTYLLACAVSILCISGTSIRKFKSLIGAWALAQAISWVVLEPMGVLLFLYFSASLWKRPSLLKKQGGTKISGQPSGTEQTTRRRVILTRFTSKRKYEVHPEPS